MWFACWLGAASVLLAGCTYDFSFSDRAAYTAVQQAERLAAPGKGPIAIEWVPPSFPDRVDEHGPWGQEGSATTARIPTGVMLASRTSELLDAAIGVSASSDKVVRIEVIEATSEYRYAIGMISRRRIDAARGVLEVAFRCDDWQWQERFSAASAAPETGGQRGMALLEAVWDELALQLTESVIANLPARPASIAAQPAQPASGASATPEPAGGRHLTALEELEALKRILLRKNLITAEDWDQAVSELNAERSQR
jgi:hypothetical protein